MPIELLRVDERLIHGQVVVAWAQRLHPERIVVVDDSISQSAMERDIYCLGVPAEIEASFVDVEEARRSLRQWQTDPRRILVLVRDVRTLRRLADAGQLDGQPVNLGGIHHLPGRERLLPYLFLSPQEQTLLREVAATGVAITARDLPGSRAVPLNELLSDRTG